MTKIKSSEQMVFTTTDGKTYTKIIDAEKHQINLNKGRLIVDLTAMIHKMFKLPTLDEVTEAYDKACELDNEDKGDEARKLFDKSDELEAELNEFFQEKCEMFRMDHDMTEVADAFIILYQEFGFRNLKKILVFISDALED